MLTLPARAEVIVKLPVTEGSTVKEGLIERGEVLVGVYIAESLVRVDKGHVITSTLNTREEEVDMPIREVQVIELAEIDSRDVARMGLTDQGEDEDNHSRSRTERVVQLFRTDHLNEEETKSLLEMCFDYQDVFYLPGDRLSSTNVVKHIITLEPGVGPINTRHYRLPESQKEEVDRQVNHLLENGIIVKSDSPWNSPLLVVPKKTGPDGERK
jgi:hypothetical protein